MNKSLLIIFLFLLVLAPVWAMAAGTAPTQIVNCGNDGKPCTFQDFVGKGGLVDTVIQFLIFGLMVPAGVVALVIAGILLVTKPGVPEARSTAKNIIWSVVIAMAIALSAYLIVKAIIVGLGPGEVNLQNVFQ